MNGLSDLLDAIERNTQALQANAAAVHSLIQIAVRPLEGVPDPAGLQARLAEQLEQGRSLAARLEALRRQLEQPAAPQLGICGVSGVGGLCRGAPGHRGSHVFS